MSHSQEVPELRWLPGLLYLLLLSGLPPLPLHGHHIFVKVGLRLRTWAILISFLPVHYVQATQKFFLFCLHHVPQLCLSQSYGQDPGETPSTSPLDSWPPGEPALVHPAWKSHPLRAALLLCTWECSLPHLPAPGQNSCQQTPSFVLLLSTHRSFWSWHQPTGLSGASWLALLFLLHLVSQNLALQGPVTSWWLLLRPLVYS